MKLKDLKFTRGKAKQTIFLLLLTTAFIIFLFTNSKAFNFMMDQWNKTISVSFTRPDSEFKILMPRVTTSGISSPRSTMQIKEPTMQRCSYKYLSPENMREGRRLLNSITWPETLHLPKPFSLNLTTSSAKSSFTIMPCSGGCRVGGNLTVSIQLRDYNGNPKQAGGDYLISRLHNRPLGAGVVGQVQDYLNGTFTAVFPLLWNGTADVTVVLVQTSESITVLKRLREEDPDRVSFSSDFISGRVTEKSICNVCLDPDRAPLCNFTDLNTGEQWFCYKPKTLDCNTRVSHTKGGFNQTISKEEESLFQRGINMKVPIMASGKSTVTILPRAGESKQMRPEPAGYYYKNQWRPLRGHTVHPFNSASVITACLKGKRLKMFGDSTIRQYYTHIVKMLPNLQTFDKHISLQCGPFMAVDHTNDIIMTHRCHGPPLSSNKVLVSQLEYVANELDRLAGGSNTVVVIGVWAHLASFTMEVYYQRLMTIVKAVQRLQNRAPGTKVIIRTANLRGLNLYDSLTCSDWYALQLDKVLRAVFKDMDVFLLDAWDMVQAHYHPHNVHPPPDIIKLMIDMILSYVCPG